MPRAAPSPFYGHPQQAKLETDFQVFVDLAIATPDEDEEAWAMHKARRVFDDAGELKIRGLYDTADDAMFAAIAWASRRSPAQLPW